MMANYVGERYFLSDELNNFPRMASYMTLDLKLSYDKESFSVYGAIRNLLDEDYYEYGTVNNSTGVKNYYPSPGRNFAIGGSLKF